MGLDCPSISYSDYRLRPAGLFAPIRLSNSHSASRPQSSRATHTIYNIAEVLREYYGARANSGNFGQFLSNFGIYAACAPKFPHLAALRPIANSCSPRIRLALQLACPLYSIARLAPCVCVRNSRRLRPCLRPYRAHPDNDTLGARGVSIKNGLAIRRNARSDTPTPRPPPRDMLCLYASALTPILI